MTTKGGGVRPLLVLAIIAVALSSGMAPKAEAGRGGWGEPWLWWSNLQNPVEQQPWYDTCASHPQDRTDCVTNPTIYHDESTSSGQNGCAWDPDDQLNFIATGRRLLPGESASWSFCLIGDWAEHLLYATTESPNLDVRLSLDGVTTITVEGQRGCIIGPEYDRDYRLTGRFEEIAGGLGVRHTVTVTATNTRAKGRSDAGLNFGIAWAGSHRIVQWCDPALGTFWSRDWPRVGSYPGPSAWVNP